MTKRAFTKTLSVCLGLAVVFGPAGACDRKGQSPPSAPKSPAQPEPAPSTAPPAVKPDVPAPQPPAAPSQTGAPAPTATPPPGGAAKTDAAGGPNLSHVPPALRQVVEAAQARMKASPDDPQAIGELGELYVVTDCLTDAALCFERAASLDPKAMCWPYYLGITRDRLYDSGGAAKAFERALELDPTYEPTHVRLGRLLLKSDQAQAKTHFEKALRMSQDDPQAPFGLGECARIAGDTDAAIQHYTRATEIAPKWAEPHRALAELLAAAGKQKEADDHRKLSNTGERLSNTNDVLFEAMLAKAFEESSSLSDIEPLLGQSRYVEAAARLEQLLKSRPTMGVRHMLAIVRAQQGRFTEAVQLFRDVLTAKPGDADAMTNLALALIQDSKFQEAEELFKKVLQTKADHGLALRGYGELLLRTGRTDAAVASLREAVRVEPQEAASSFYLAGALVASRKLDEAVAEYQRARGLISEAGRPGVVMARQLASWMAGPIQAGAQGKPILEPQDAAAFADRLEERGLKDDAEAVRNYALILAADALATAERGQFDQAVDFLKRFMAIDKKGTLQNALASVCAMRGQFDESAKMFREVLKADPENLAAKSGLATSLAGVGQNEEAERLFRELLEKNPDDVSILRRFARLKMVQGKTEESLSMLNRAVELRPSDATSHQALGETLARAGKAAEATQHLQEAVKLDPRLGGALFALGSLSAQTGDLAAARNYWQQAIQAEPAYAEPYLSLAATALKAKNYAEALRFLREGLKWVPQSPLLANALAWCLATCPIDASRNGAEAVRLAEQACRATQNKNPEFLDTLAAAYAEAGRFDDAMKTIRQAISLAESSQQKVDLESFKRRSALYSSRKAYHEE